MRLNSIVGSFNIVKDYDWTAIPRGAELRNKAPKVIVRSYRLKSNAILNRLKNYLQLATSSSSEEFYKKMYGDATAQEDDFYFPYFDNQLRGLGNTFSDTYQNGVGAGLESKFGDDIKVISQIVAMGTSAESRADAKSKINQGDYGGALKSLASGLGKGGAAGSYIENPKFYDYQSAKENALTVSFKLANTINSDFMKNFELVQKLIEINRPKRNDAISLDPPRIYKVKLPGYRFMPWAYVNDLQIGMEGARRMINGVIIPEAYDIKISFEPLTIEVSNFLKQS